MKYYKMILAEEIKEDEMVQYAAVYITNAIQLRDAGIEIKYYFVEVDE